VDKGKMWKSTGAFLQLDQVVVGGFLKAPGALQKAQIEKW
jgi:hypothetical protein